MAEEVAREWADGPMDLGLRMERSVPQLHGGRQAFKGAIIPCYRQSSDLGSEKPRGRDFTVFTDAQAALERCKNDYDGRNTGQSSSTK
jgi:hypothetical protein